jgi:hypothetical protein
VTDTPLDRLKQARALQQFRSNGKGPWTIVYSSWRNNTGHGGYFSAFSDPSRREKALSDAGWDVSDGYGSPGFAQSFGGSKPVTHYYRYSRDGLEPLVLLQDFYGGLPEMLPQLTDEFRLYHNLWVNPEGTKLIKMNSDGTRYDAAKISNKEVRVRTNLLKQFQAGRQMDLLLFIDSVQYAEDLPEADSQNYEALSEEYEDAEERISFTASRNLAGGCQDDLFSRLLGTKVLLAPDQCHAGVWPFDEDDPQRYPDFIIGEDENGRPVTNTCDPELLANYFGKNPDAPHYLTPVFFRRGVLQKYYEEAEKYTVTDGYLSCASLWGVRIDNDHPDHIMVFLGDLGRDLPESERDHWRSHNVAPTSSMSETNFRRSFLSQSTWPVAPDLRFKYRYNKLRADWLQTLDWELFREPVEADTHVLKRLRIPLTESQPEFEGQVLNLAKTLIDSLNDSTLDAHLSSKVKDERSIAKLKRWLEQESYAEVEPDIAVLKKIQLLRSRAAAHRKGSDYEEFLTKELGSDGLIQGFAKLLVDATEVLVHLRDHFLPCLVDNS